MNHQVNELSAALGGDYALHLHVFAFQKGFISGYALIKLPDF